MPRNSVAYRLGYILTNYIIKGVVFFIGFIFSNIIKDYFSGAPEIVCGGIIEAAHRYCNMSCVPNNFGVTMRYDSDR